MAGKTIKLAIDANEANTTNRVGSNVYAFELLMAMSKIVESSQDIVCTLLLAAPPVSDMPPATKKWQYIVIGPARFWTQWALPIFLYRNKGDFQLLFTPGHYAPQLCPVPYVSSVMDTAYISHPTHFLLKDYLQLKYWTRFSVRKAQKVIAISQSTKNAVIEHYGISPKNVVVAYPGFRTEKTKLSHNQQVLILKQLKVTQPFILFIGTIQPRKNLDKLVESYEILTHKLWGRKLKSKKNTTITSSPPQLVIAGKAGWLSQNILERIKNSPVAKQIIMTGYITEDQKSALLNNAACTTLLGTEEGFGIPPLESMAVGTIPVVANSASLPEVIGDAGYLVNPFNPPEIAETFYSILNLSAKQRSILRRKMRQQINKFSWERTAEVVLAALKEVAGRYT